jgi:hypothetical protein
MYIIIRWYILSWQGSTGHCSPLALRPEASPHLPVVVAAALAAWEGVNHQNLGLTTEAIGCNQYSSFTNATLVLSPNLKWSIAATGEIYRTPWFLPKKLGSMWDSTPNGSSHTEGRRWGDNCHASFFDAKTAGPVSTFSIQHPKSNWMSVGV